MKACDIENRVGIAAGFVRTKEVAKELAYAGIRRMVFGSNMLKERPGNYGETFIASSCGSTWNNRGLPGKTLSRMLSEDVVPFIRWCDEEGIAIQVFVSVAAFSAEELCKCARVIRDAKFDESTLLVKRLAGVEVNGSCQNTKSTPIAFDSSVMQDALAPVCQMLRPLPVGFKLPPYLGRCALRNNVCLAAEQAGVGYLTTCNTLGALQVPVVLTGEVVRIFGREFSEGSFGGSIIQRISRHELKMVLGIVDGRVPVESVGGIMDAEEVKLRIGLGARAVQLASLVQIYGTRAIAGLFSGLLTEE
jgi:dihydroorotate dehydrogenase